MKKIIIPIITLSAIMFLVNMKYFVTYLGLPVVTGWDGSSHAAIGQYYAEHIFPRTWGWVPNWFGGMPFPQYYPPLFYFILALIYKVLPIFSYNTIFKWFVLILTFSIPPALFFITKKVTKKEIIAWISGLSTAGLLLYFNSTPDVSIYGVSIRATFNNGEITQTLGFFVFIIWTCYFIYIENSRNARYVSIIFLSLVFLSNVHIVLPAAIFFFTTFFVRGIIGDKFKKWDWEWIRLYTLQGFVPLFATAFWYIPMLVNYKYTPASSLYFGEILDPIKRLASILILIISALYISFRRKNWEIFIYSLSTLIVATVTFSGIENIFHSLPLHADRWLAIVYFVGPISTSYALYYIITKFKKPLSRIFITGGILILISAHLWYFGQAIDYSGFYFDYAKDPMSNVITTLKKIQEKGSGMLTIEYMWTNNQPVTFVFNALAGLEGIKTDYIVFRESSISSIFFTSIRNQFSHIHECWNLRSSLCLNTTFMNQPIEDKIKRAEFMGIQYIFVRSKPLQDNLAKAKATLVFDQNNWKVFELPATSTTQVVSGTSEPVLLFFDVDLKKFDSSNYYNYITFMEEAYSFNFYDPFFAETNDLNLDTSTDLDKFRTIIISKYQYKNLDSAFQRLEKYSQKNNIILISDYSNPLFNRLSDLNRKNHKIAIFQKGDFNPVIFSYIKSIDKKITPATIKDIDENDKEIKITMGTSSPNTPILIKTSYFPWWKRTDGKPIYMATPTYMLTFTDGENLDIKFTTPWYLYLGIGVSSLTTLLVLISFIYLHRKKHRSSDQYLTKY